MSRLRKTIRAAALAAILFQSMATFVHAQAVAPESIATAEEAQFVYRFRTRDTLIQVCRRLLLQPQRWPEVQRRNGIRDPFNIPPDTPIRVPYSWLRLAPDTAIVRAVAGSATRDGVPLAPGDVLDQGMRIETAANGSVSIQFADQSILTLQKSSVLRLERMQRVQGVNDGHSAELKLESGRAETTITPKRDVGRFEIVTPVAISAVRGTQFRTGFDGATSHATTETLEGTVGVDAAGGSVAVRAGFGTRVESTGAVLPPVPLLPAPDLKLLPSMNTRDRLSVEFPPLPLAASYRAQLAADAGFSALLVDESSTSPAFDLAAPPDGDYWLRVRGVDALGIEGNDAVQSLSQHVLPTAPAIVAPTAGTRLYTGSVTLRWSPLIDVAGYRLQLARDSQFTDLVAERQTDSGTTAEIGGLSPGSYYWRMAGVNSRGEPGAWSEAANFTQRPLAPGVEASRVDRRELRLSWQAQPGEQYRLQISRDAGFERPVVDTVLTAGEYTIVRPAAGTYHARLQVRGDGPAEDPFGQSSRFEVPIPVWLKILLGTTVLLPAVL